MSNYYVAKTGSDQHPGTFSYPFLTVAEGLHSMNVGDTLYVLSGTYTEDFTFTPTVRLDASVWTTTRRVVSYPGEVVVLQDAQSGVSKTLTYFSLRGSLAVQDPANYQGVTLLDISNQRDNLESNVHALSYVVGGTEFVTDEPDDLTKPTASIDSPSDGDVVSGTVTVVASFEDNAGVLSSGIKLDGEYISNGSQEELEFVWGTTRCLNGLHVLTGWVKDLTGNVGVSAPVTITVDNAPPIEEPDTSLTTPSLTVTCPYEGAVWMEGTVVDLVWDSVGVEGNVNIYFFREGVRHEAFSNIPNTGTVSWTVLGPRAPHCRIWVCSIDNPSVKGISPEFSVV